MTSSVDREPLSGVIRQNDRVVGAVCLPEDDLLDFIIEFNHCYGPLALHIDAPEKPIKDDNLFPIGAKRKPKPGKMGPPQT